MVYIHVGASPAYTGSSNGHGLSFYPKSSSIFGLKASEKNEMLEKNEHAGPFLRKFAFPRDPPQVLRMETSEFANDLGCASPLEVQFAYSIFRCKPIQNYYLSWSQVCIYTCRR
jgi:hypothetical protein